MRRVASVVGGVVLAGCMPVGPLDGEPAVAPQAPLGPTLVLEVTNRSDAAVEVGYEYEADSFAGGGGGSVGPCERLVMPFGEVRGTYEVTVDGATIHDGIIPAGMRAGVFVVVPVRVDAAGAASAGTPRIVNVQPPGQGAAIRVCS